MAIFLIFDHDNTHADPVKDAAGCYKRGDIVQVFDDAETVVRPPAPPFVVVKVAGITKGQAEQYTRGQMDVDGRTMLRRRLHGLSWADLPAGVRQALIADRYYETTWAAVRAYVKNKLTGIGA
jgi:hypothetical protein